MGATWVRLQDNTVAVRELVLQAFAAPPGQAVPLVKHAAVLCLKALLKQSCSDVHWLGSSLRFLDAVSIPQILKPL